MRLSIGPLRAGILIVNLALLATLVVTALQAFNVVGSAEGEKARPERIGRSDFRPNDVAPSSGRSHVGAVANVSSGMIPTKPTAVTTPTNVPSGDAGEPESTGEEEYDGGPLEDEWEYTFYMLFPSDPLSNFARISKKKPDGAKASRTTTSRGRSTYQRRSTAALARRGKTAAKDDSVAFSVRQRLVKNEDADVEFYVHSADNRRLVYWIPGRPQRMYALPFKSSSPFIREPEKRVIAPSEVKDDDDKEKKAEIIRIVKGDDSEAAFEAEYQQLLGGKKNSSGASSRDSGGLRRRQISPAASSAGADEESPRTPRKPTAEEVKELRDAIQNIPAEERKRMNEELKGMLGK